MALATRCPNCQVLFRVVADQLKLRGGLVRCGSCRHVFDAIGSLAYVDDASMPPLVPSRVTAKPHAGPLTLRITPGSAPVRMPDARAHSPAPAGADARGDVRMGANRSAGGDADRKKQQAARLGADEATTASPRDGAAARADRLQHSHSAERLIRSQRPERKSSAVSASAAGVPTLMAGAPMTGSATQTPATTASAGTKRDVEASDDDDVLLAPRRLRARQAAKSRAEPVFAKAAHASAAPDSGPGTLDEEDLDPEFLRSARARRGFSLVFGGGAAVLLTLLLAQFAVVISRWPSLRPTLSQLCEVAGCTVGWPTRAELLAVVGSELQAIPGTDILELTAVIRNRAAFKVALPALEVALTDTSNRTLARKVFEPVDYLASNGESGSRIGEGLGPGSDYTLHVVFEARGLSAAGFVVYPFYL